jgi:excisionase family DNA binding protein
VELQISDEFIRELVTRARELGLLDVAGEPDPWLSTEQAADYLACSEGQVLNHVSTGRIPRRYQRGHKARFKRSDLDVYVEGKAA